MASDAANFIKRLSLHSRELQLSVQEANKCLSKYEEFNPSKFTEATWTLKNALPSVTEILSLLDDILQTELVRIIEWGSCKDEADTAIEVAYQIQLSARKTVASLKGRIKNIEDYWKSLPPSVPAKDQGVVASASTTDIPSSENSFLRLITKPYFVDKTMMIEVIIKYMFEEQTPDPLLITGPRRFGKTTILAMLVAYFNGIIPSQNLDKLLISKSKEAEKWYGKCVVIYITFGMCSGNITSLDDCIEACRSIIHHAFREHYFLKSNIPEHDVEAFEDWVDEVKYHNKTKEDISRGIVFLVECALNFSNNTKPCLLLVDEFDMLCAKALFKVSGDTLKDIVDFYSNMVGQAVKHSMQCYSFFTGVAAFTSSTWSSLNNINHISFLEDVKIAAYYGITMVEFSDLMKRRSIRVEVRKKKNLAISYYNGYKIENLSLLNTYSVVRFLQSGNVKGYWNRSGIAVGLKQGIKFRTIRNDITKLLTGSSIKIEFRNSINIENFHVWRNKSYELKSTDVIMCFLYQQGYVTIDEYYSTGVSIKIPNLEIQEELTNRMTDHFVLICKFDPEEMKKCCNAFMSMNLLDVQDCHAKLKTVKEILNNLLGREKLSNLNESWLESFIFSVFVQNFNISSQKRVPETMKKNDLRTAKVLDLFIEMDDRSFVFEESLRESAQDALKKLVKKKYYMPAVNKGVPYLLVSFNVGVDESGNAEVTMAYLQNTYEGEINDV